MARPEGFEAGGTTVLGPGEGGGYRGGRGPDHAPARFLLVFQPDGFERYFRELTDLIAEEDTWPPEDPSKVTELAARHDTYELPP